MSKYLTLTELRQECEAHLDGKITSQAKLLAALPFQEELRKRVDQAKTQLKRAQETLQQLYDATAKYVLAHQSVTDRERIVTLSNGAQTCDVTHEGKTYHLSSGYGPIKRIDGESLTQDFLDDLPEGWVKTRFELDTQKLKRDRVSEEQLEKQGLYRPVKNVWSEKDPEAVAVEE